MTWRLLNRLPDQSVLAQLRDIAKSGHDVGGSRDYWELHFWKTLSEEEEMLVDMLLGSYYIRADNKIGVKNADQL